VSEKHPERHYSSEKGIAKQKKYEEYFHQRSFFNIFALKQHADYSKAPEPAG
jgi:hypothetical protein